MSRASNENSFSVDAILEELLLMCRTDKRNDKGRSPFLETNRQRVRKLGQELDRIGGWGLMAFVYERIPEEDQHELDGCWHDIGRWRASLMPKLMRFYQDWLTKLT